MKPDRNVKQCRWAEETLFLAAPQWLDAWNFPWSCRATGTWRPVEDTRLCRTCERWLPRERAIACTCGGDCC